MCADDLAIVIVKSIFARESVDDFDRGLLAAIEQG
jgi:hypothetical protein